MKKGFTLIELIFTIVIIGILAAVAIPKYKNLKISAKINSYFKVANDIVNSAPGAYINSVDLNGENESNLELEDLVKASGKNWSYVSSTTNNQYRGYYKYVDLDIGSEASVVLIGLHKTKKEIIYMVNCTRYASGSKERELCERLNGGKESITANIGF